LRREECGPDHRVSRPRVIIKIEPPPGGRDLARVDIRLSLGDEVLALVGVELRDEVDEEADRVLEGLRS